MSLADFVKPACPVCVLPHELLREMHVGYEQNVRYSAMQDWLKTEHEITLSYAKIKQHFVGGHHAR